MASELPNNALVSTYRNRFGEPADTNEVYGYWLFLAGGVVGILGILLFVLAALGGGGPPARKPGYALAALGLAAALTGAVYRLPSYRTGDTLTVLGFVGTLVGVVGFYTVFPRGWEVGSQTAVGVVLLYSAGIAVVVLGGIVAPVLFGVSRDAAIRGEEIGRLERVLAERDVSVDELEERLEASEGETAAASGERDELRADLEATREDLAETEAERDDLRSTVTALESDLETAREETDDLRSSLAATREDLEAAEAETGDLREELAEAEAAGDRLSADLEAARERADAAAADRDALAATVATYEDSNGTFDVYKDAADKWRWRLVHRNGNIIASSGQGYSSNRTARRGMRSVKRNALGAAVVWQPVEADEEEPEPAADPVREESRATFELYEDAAGEHRWRLRHDNGNVISAAVRGFASKSNARTAIDRVGRYAATADYLAFDPAGFEVYEDAAGEWRWRLVHRNGNILADPGDGYASRSGARSAAAKVAAKVADAPVDPEGTPDGHRFETFEDNAGRHRWRLVARNGNVVADSGQGYGEPRELNRAIERVKEYAPEADTLSVFDAAFELFEDGEGEHRWRLRHRNGTIIAGSGEGYTSRSGAVEAINGVKRNAPNAETVEDGDAEE